MKNQKRRALLEVKAETERFLKKLNEAIESEPADRGNDNPNKKWAAARRSALDMKNELSKITTFMWNYRDATH